VHPIAELSQVAREFHHVQGEHAREGLSSSRRRRQRARMEELEEKFETLLLRWVPSATEQPRWREHFYRGAEAPADLLPDNPAPLFRGRSELGITLEIRATENEQELLLEGAVVDRLPLRSPITSPVLYGDSEFHELFEAAPDALEALLDYIERRADEPPWARARELYEEGMIDENFGLTARGRRYREARRR
jgi:hypothetical protein